MSDCYAFIWDLDGTLLDSYTIIVESFRRMFAEVNVELDPQDIHDTVLKESCSAFIHRMETQTGIDFNTLKTRYSEVSGEEQKKIGLVPHAKEVLEELRERGYRNFVFTHRGLSTGPVLDNLELKGYFDEIITGADGFPRKPDGTAIEYLINKYGLNKEKTFYVGDRTIDMECARNAGIRGIMYLERGSVVTPTGAEAFIVSDLIDIPKLLE